MSLSLHRKLTGRSLGLLALGAALALGSVRSAEAGAWNEPTGHWLDINALSYYAVNTNGYNQLGQPAGSGLYQQLEFAPYIEYGLADRWTIGLQPRVQEIQQSNLPGTARAFGLVQLNLFARYQLYRDDWNAVAVQEQVDISGVQTGMQPQLAQPNDEYETRLLYGRNLALPHGWSGFIDLEAAYRFETEGWANQLRLDATAGLRPLPDWTLLVQSFNTVGVSTPNPGQPDYNLYRMEISLVHDLTPHVAVQFGAWHDLGGRDISLGNAGVLALWLRF
ncbi:hypothetical protein [Acidisoma sp. C75]